MTPSRNNGAPSGSRKRSIPDSDDEEDVLAKKIKDGLIDDQIARQIFRDLGVNDRFFHSGSVLAWALSPEEEDFINIHDYVQRSQPGTIGVKILSILRTISKANDFQEFHENPHHRGKQRMMLWHGTSKHAVCSILENGLKLPDKNIPQFFGKGIYFGDRICTSIGYCQRWQGLSPGDVCYLLLCDVLLGNIYGMSIIDRAMDRPPPGFDSVKGLGYQIPDYRWNKMVNGTIWPVGPWVSDYRYYNRYWANHQVAYNEYVVFNQAHVQPKYLVKVQITRKPYYEKLT